MLRLRTLLTPNAILILETPDCTGVVDIKTRDDFRKVHPLDHINAFTPDTLVDMAKRAGFSKIAKPISCVACEPKDCQGYWQECVRPTSEADDPDVFQRFSPG